MRQPEHASAGADRSRAKGALLVLALVFHAPAALALGLGPLRVQSALDQPLRAEIELSGVQEAELRTLEVALARKDEFARASVPRADHLLQLKFEIAQAADGRRVVKLSSKKAIKEPFLQFVVAAQWSGGRVVREYTALLDPPLYAGDKPAPVSTPRVVADERAGPAAAPAAKPVKPIVGGPVGEPAGAAKEKPARALLPEGGAAGRSAEYGPVEKGDTLWDIASQLDSGGAEVNIFQVLIALFRENPDAFVNGNINRLKKGAILKLGSVEAIAAIPKKEASRVYQAQLEEWLAYKGKVAQDSTLTKIPDAPTKPKATAAEKTPGGEVAAATERPAKPAEKREPKEAAKDAPKETPKEAAKATAPELRIVQAPAGAEAAKDKKAADAAAVETLGLRNQIGTLEESLASRERENLELRERVALLETQIKNATRLVQIESQQLAQGQQAGQQKAAAEPEKMPVAGAVTAPAAPVTAVAAKPSEAPAAPVEPAKVAEVPKPQPETPKPAAEPKKAEEPAAVAPPPKAAEAPRPADRPAETKIRVEAPKPAAPGFLDNLFGFLSDSISGWTLGGLGAMATALGGLMYYRRRRSLAEFQESVLMGGQGPTTTTASEPNPTRTDTSFLSDFGLGGVNVQADEVDPLAEAEVYLAYGRDEQAEEVLRDAAGRNPNRLELKTKLLEIYKQRKDVKAFETLAEELYPASGKGDPEVWKKVAAMGREINPENPLFAMELPVDAFERKDIFRPTAERAAPAKVSAAAAARPAATAPAAPLPLPEVSEAPRRAAPATDEITLAAPHGEDLDLGLDSFDRADKTGGDELLDFDWETDKPAVITSGAGKFDDFTLELPGRDEAELKPAPAAEARSSPPKAPAVRSGFDFDVLEAPAAAPPLKPDTAWPPAFAPETIAQAGAAAPAAEPAQPSWALEPAAEIKPATALEAPSAPAEDALAWDEAATKLELARAYLDMGDKVGARSILDEVLKEGNPAQQGQAKTLVAQLAA